MEEKNEPIISYKIMAGRKYRVFKQTFDKNGSGDKVFYKIQMSQKMYDDTTKHWYKQVVFKKGVDLPNETDIIIHHAIENLRDNRLDKYNPVSYLMITDFEIVERQEQVEAQAYADYQNKLNENEMEMSEEDLPF